MPPKVELSLADIISKNKSSAPNRGRKAGGRPGRGNSERKAPRSSAGFRNSKSGGNIKARQGNNMNKGGPSSIRPVSKGPTMLNIGNLEFGVTEADLKELFSEFGTMRRANIKYDRRGKSLGKGQVVFDRRENAMKAIKRYNGVHLDGRAMHIKIVTSGGSGQNVRASNGIQQRLGPRKNIKGLQESPRRPFGGPKRQTNSSGGTRKEQTSNSGGKSGPGAKGKRKGGQGNKDTKKTLTVDQLDKELDDYTAKAKKNMMNQLDKELAESTIKKEEDDSTSKTKESDDSTPKTMEIDDSAPKTKEMDDSTSEAKE